MRALVILTALAALAAGGPALAAGKTCRGAGGKFVTCPAPAAAAAKPARCKDARGKFAKCGAAGAKPA